MKLFLQLIFSWIFFSMIGVTTKAQSITPIWRIPRQVSSDPWFVATLHDAYFGFLTTYLWIYHKESKPTSRLFWFCALALGGNIASSLYILLQLKNSGSDFSMEKLLSEKNA